MASSRRHQSAITDHFCGAISSRTTSRRTSSRCVTITPGIIPHYQAQVQVEMQQHIQLPHQASTARPMITLSSRSLQASPARPMMPPSGHHVGFNSGGPHPHELGFGPFNQQLHQPQASGFGWQPSGFVDQPPPSGFGHDGIVGQPHRLPQPQVSGFGHDGLDSLNGIQRPHVSGFGLEGFGLDFGHTGIHGQPQRTPQPQVLGLGLEGHPQQLQQVQASSFGRDGLDGGFSHEGVKGQLQKPQASGFGRDGFQQVLQHCQIVKAPEHRHRSATSVQSEPAPHGHGLPLTHPPVPPSVASSYNVPLKST
jgi:hypothetical protein